jgi:uncharacterized protein DUF3857/transglutaminase superfamily protein
MGLTYRRFLLLLTVVVCSPAFGAANWRQPTPDELKMTSDPKAPDAPAVYLNRDEYMDVKGHYDRVYARIKILTEKGRLQFSDVEIPYRAGVLNVRALEGRTIHSDGTIVPFTGQAYSKELVKSGDVRVMARVFSMPDVQVGSILEYQYELQYDDMWIFYPEWTLQERVFVHEAHYHFIPYPIALNSSNFLMVPDPQGRLTPATRLQYDASLPPGARFQDLPSGTDLVMNDVAAIPDEPYSPPLGSFSYRLFYYYTGNFSAQDFWKGAGKSWSQKVDRFAAQSDAIGKAVTGIVAPGDADEQKLKKIYDAAMTVENTEFSREHSEAENKAQGLQVKTAADIWAQKRGTPNEITRLFIAMTRAAGMKASAMIVTERDKRVLNANYLHWDQLTDEIAIVTVGGKEMYFDPGQRYCDYGKLHWKHTQVLGIRQTDNGTEAVLTPAAEYKDSVVDRKATLQLGPDGTLQGTITLSMTGVEALRWRQVALRNDEEETKKRIGDELQRLVPDGVRVKTTGLTGLTDESLPLVATLEVSGSMGTATGKRILLPGSFFEANAKPLFPEERRENPVDLHFPYAVRDSVKIALAPGLTVDSLPANAQVPFPKNADYVAKYGGSGSVFQQARLMALGKTVYSKDEYPQLRDFFQKVNAQDQQQLVLDRAPAAASAAGGSGANE